MSAVILICFIVVFLGLLATIITVGVLSAKDSGKNDWTTTTAYSCDNFTISGSGSCSYGAVICKYDYNNITYEAYLKYPRTKPTLWCSVKSDVTAWLESTKGRNVTCALEHIGQNSEGYPKCLSTTEKYCY